MASDSDLAALIQLGRDITSLKLYAASVTALWAYDYFLTLEDEIRYAWKTERLFAFVLFLVTRYLPAVFQTWTLVTMEYLGYTNEVFLSVSTHLFKETNRYYEQACQKTAFLQIAYNTCITAAAQIVLTQRAYALTGKNKWTAVIMYGIFTLQLGISIFAVVWSATGPISQIPPIPLDAYRVCLTRTSRTLTIVQLSLSLSFDVVVFLLVLIQRRLIRSRYQGMSGPDILGRITRDAEIYFGVIAVSHFVVVIMLAAAGIPPIPLVGNAVYIPMMISRMIMSLKKVASSAQTHMGVDIPLTLPMNPRDSCIAHRVGGTQLSTFKR